MREEIFEDDVESSISNNTKPLFDNSIDAAKLQNDKSRLQEEWRILTEDEKKHYDGKIKKFYSYHLPQFDSDALFRANNYLQVKTEVDARLQSEQRVSILSINQLHMEQALSEIIESLENTENIRSLYRLRKFSLKSDKKAGLNEYEAKRLKNCLRQGRELYFSGKLGPLMVKPLNFFYSITAYAYVITILNNPIRHSLDHLPGSHGLNYIRSGNKIQFGGDTPHGTLSELACSFPTLLYKTSNLEIVVDNQQTLYDFFEKKWTVSLGTFLSMIPEIREYYTLLTGKKSRAHPLHIESISDIRNAYFRFHIGDGNIEPNINYVEQAFPRMEIAKSFGKVIVSVPTTMASNLKVCIFLDANGSLWFIENPFYPSILPEICIHFFIVNTFSNIMRYSPDIWGDILLNEVDSDVSLITRKYLSTFENKLPFLVLRNISKFLPYISR